MSAERTTEVIIFDVDGTLSEDISWLKITEGLGADPQLHASIFDRFKRKEISYPDAKGQLVQLWQKTGNANKQFMENMFRSWDLKEDAVETLNYLKEKYRVCLMSGAVDLYVMIVAEKLGVQDWFANTELIWDADEKLIDFNYFADQSAKKLEQFHKFIQEYDLKKENCAVVGDGDSDISLFRELPFSVAVNKQPNSELESLASQHIDNLIALKEIF